MYGFTQRDLRLYSEGVCGCVGGESGVGFSGAFAAVKKENKA